VTDVWQTRSSRQFRVSGRRVRPERRLPAGGPVAPGARARGVPQQHGGGASTEASWAAGWGAVPAWPSVVHRAVGCQPPQDHLQRGIWHRVQTVFILAKHRCETRTPSRRMDMTATFLWCTLCRLDKHSLLAVVSGARCSPACLPGHKVLGLEIRCPSRMQARPCRAEANHLRIRMQQQTTAFNWC
jgi:hypothetical protein